MHDDVESENSDAEGGGGNLQEEHEVLLSAGSFKGRNGRGHAHGKNISSGGDLRKKLLKSEQAKLTSQKTRAQEAASPAVSRFASPIPVEEERTELVSSLRWAPKEHQCIFFTNTTFHTLLRLIEVRLLLPFYSLGQN